jgi:16S rRNA (adenine1518-N6/adenine1519-N6)-dimethyltransferase
MLGQNFLIDSNISKRIVDSAEISEGEKVLEIGPGRGALTELLSSKGNLIAIEKDKWLSVVLKQKFKENVEIIEGDILKWDVPPIDVIVANLPYSISSPILFRLFNYEWTRAVLMFQEEFANRLNHFVDTKKLFKVSKTAFQPQPKIHSQVVKLVRREPDYMLDDFETFEKVVKSIFTHRRKKIRNCIKLTFPNLDLDNLNYMDLRAEILTPSEIAELSNSIFRLKLK